MALNQEVVKLTIGEDEFIYQPDAEGGPLWFTFDAKNREYELTPGTVSKVLQAYAPNCLEK